MHFISVYIFSKETEENTKTNLTSATNKALEKRDKGKPQPPSTSVKKSKLKRRDEVDPPVFKGQVKRLTQHEYRPRTVKNNTLTGAINL